MSQLPNQLKYSYLCELMWNNNYANNSKGTDLLMGKLKSTYSLSESEQEFLRHKIVTVFLTQFKKKWISVSRRRDRFQLKYKDFLEKMLVLNIGELDNEITDDKISDVIVKKGRPRLSFEKGSNKTKIRRATELASNHAYDELQMALKVKQKETPKVNDAESEDETEESNYNDRERNQALAMFTDARLSKETYRKIREHNLQMFGSKMYPPYDDITKAKQDCYPDHIEINDLGASVHFISLLDHTIRRIFQLIDEKELLSLKQEQIEFLGKWGMDGAGEQQTTRQSWSLEEHCDDSDPSDKSVFITCFVPLRLRAGSNILWVNSKPNSVTYCRPISFQFIKETVSVITSNYQYYNEMLEKIENYCLEFHNMNYNIKFNMKCSMLDGKAGYAITGQVSSASCNLCGAKPNEMNDIDMVLKRKCKTEFYKFGFPILHSWIRFMEYLLHISYNLDFQEYMAKGENKVLKKNRKSRVQSLLKNQLQLNVDIVKQGSGTTNTGNVGRAFFEKAGQVSELIGVKKDIIERLYTVLQVISCGNEIDLIKFKTFCIETAKECINSYPWYKMPPSVHKVLIHGCDIMKEFNAPMIWFSEEPQEAQNKVFRKARSEHSRMYQRSITNEDIMHYELISSDPVITSFRKIVTKEKKNLTPKAQQFVKQD